MLLEAKLVREHLKRIHDLKPAPFGVNFHRCVLNPTISDSAVRHFEKRYGISLPPDYRHFLTEIGNGGAGPYYGVFPLGTMDSTGSAFQAWHEGDGIVGALSQPFLLTDAWNDLTGEPDSSLADSNPELYEQQIELFAKSYWASHRVNGAIPICHLGCAIRIWLVVTGKESGHLWRDGRAEYSGLSPVKLHDDLRARFGAWYSQWLNS